MFKIFFLLIITAIMSSAIVFANDEEETIEQKLASLKLERIQAEIMIKKMRKIGRLSEKEMNQATRSIASIKEDSINDIRASSLKKIINVNSLATK